MRSGNPVLKDSTFLDIGTGSVVTRDGQTMTLNGTVNKTGFLLLLSVLTAAFAWSRTFTDSGEMAPGAMIYLIGGAIGGLVLALVTAFKKEWSPVTAPMYAIVEGFFLGTISAIYNAQFQGIVLQAVMLTFGIMFALLFAYRTGLIKATENFKLGVAAATGGIIWNQDSVHPRIRLDRYRLQPLRGGHRLAESGAGFRLHRNRRRSRRTEVHGVVRRFRPDGHAGVAVPGTAALAVEAAVAQLTLIREA
jgi:hypothetical protein